MSCNMIFLVILNLSSVFGFSIKMLDPSTEQEDIKLDYFPRTSCVSRKEPDAKVCPQLYFCIHRGEKVYPNSPMKCYDDCEEYRCECPVKIGAKRVQCKSGYQSCQWIYEGCRLVRIRMTEGFCGAQH